MKKAFLFISLLILTQISLGQEIIQDNQKPKIGLVLSGGGAKGLAHIGVLKVIDSLGIKVDYIGGTSMGAIIGGLYASGYSGKELDSIFQNVDTDALIQDYVPRGSKNFYEKRNDEIYALTLPFQNFKIGLPKALSKGMYNYNLLSRLTKHVSHTKDFNQLPIPFFCVATDVENGKEVILDSGILAQSMIASGAIPSLYNPIQIDGKLLVDGGVVNNYPIEHIKELGVDIVIGVDVQDGLKDRNELKGATSVLVQISNFAMISKMESKKNLTDIYIKPDIKGYNVISFDKGNEIIPKGVEAANQLISQLELLVSDAPKHFIEKNILKNDSIFVKEISIKNNKNYTRAFVIGKLGFKPNSKISFKELEKGINNLNATQNFNAITYSFEEIRKDEDLLIIDVDEKEESAFLRFGLHYDELFKSSILVNYTKKKLFAKNDVFSIDAIVGDNFRYNFDYYIDNGFYWSFGVKSKLQQFNRNVPNDFNNGITLSNLGINTINIDYIDFTHQAYLQTIFAQKFSLGGGFEFKHLRISSPTIENITPLFDDSDYLSFFGYLKYDSFDSKYFPKKGWTFNSEFKTFVYSSNYNEVYENFSITKADFAIVKTFFNKLSFKFESEAGFHIGENTVNFFDFALGGYGFSQVNNLRPFYGYDFISLVGDSYIKTGFTLDYEFIKKHHINFSANYSNLGNKIFEDTSKWINKPLYSGYQLGYGLESIIGPLEIKHSWSPETRDHHTWFSIGFWF